MTAAEDFVNGPIADIGVSVTRTPITTSINNLTGQKTYSAGTPETITVVFANPDQVYNLGKEGETENADALMFVQSTQTINKRDKISFNSKDYRVGTVSERFFGAIAYKRVTLFVI